MEPRNALLFIYDTACRATLVSKENGRESGLTAGDHAQLRQMVEVAGKALDAGAAAAARATELEAKLTEFETNLKERDDRYAVLTGELDQLKSELEALKSPDTIVLTEYAKDDCVHRQ